MRFSLKSEGGGYLSRAAVNGAVTMVDIQAFLPTPEAVILTKDKSAKMMHFFSYHVLHPVENFVHHPLLHNWLHITCLVLECFAPHFHLNLKLPRLYFKIHENFNLYSSLSNKRAAQFINFWKISNWKIFFSSWFMSSQHQFHYYLLNLC